MRIGKILLAMLLAAAMILSLAACGGETPPTEPANPAGPTEPVEPSEPAEPAEPAESGAPVITVQPESQKAEEDTLVSFAVEASGDNLTYQWYYRLSPDKDWKLSTLDTATMPTLKVKALATRDGHQYMCQVSNAAGSAYTDIVTLTVG